ncbi:MAG: helix-turn-helix transcriptional regulator [Afipia sp.]|nr:helix-turn-helix transcriptional regulator [Afipia sp.]
MNIDVSPDQLSIVIGKIYDSAIEPALWPDALEACCGLIGATLGAINLYDLEDQKKNFTARWGGDPYWIELLQSKYAKLDPFWEIYPTFQVGDVANTATLLKRLGAEEDEVRQRPFFAEWATPAGYRDVAAGILLRSPTRSGTFELHTPLTRDLVGPNELAIATLLNPHMRRAATIGDLLDMRSLATAAFEATLEALSAAVVLVDANSRILYSNQSARTMFSDDDPVQSQRGVLVARDINATTAIRDAIAHATQDESELGYGGIGVPIRSRDPQIAPHSVAHVLPLKSGMLRPGLSLGAAAAVFITPSANSISPPFEALAALYDLTPMEARVMIEIASGKNRATSATALGIADSTVKTHLARVFEKTRTSEQPELAKLVASLTSPAVVRTNP